MILSNLDPVRKDYGIVPELKKLLMVPGRIDAVIYLCSHKEEIYSDDEGPISFLKDSICPNVYHSDPLSHSNIISIEGVRFALFNEQPFGRPTIYSDTLQDKSFIYNDFEWTCRLMQQLFNADIIVSGSMSTLFLGELSGKLVIAPGYISACSSHPSFVLLDIPGSLGSSIQSRLHVFTYKFINNKVQVDHWEYQKSISNDSSLNFCLLSKE